MGWALRVLTEALLLLREHAAPRAVRGAGGCRTAQLIRSGRHIVTRTLRAAERLRLDRSRCRDPYVTGTSVLGITFKDGVMLAADTLGAAPPPRAHWSLTRASTQDSPGAGSPVCSRHSRVCLTSPFQRTRCLYTGWISVLGYRSENAKLPPEAV